MIEKSKNKARRKGKSKLAAVAEAVAKVSLRDLRCPNCGTELRGPTGKTAMHCKHCGARWIAE